MIDTAAIPRAGYIGPVANIVVTNLLDVYPQESASPSIMTTLTGTVQIIVTNAARPALTIALAPGEAKQFADLTDRAVRKRLLVMLGTNSLTAPATMTPIETGTVMIEFGKELEGRQRWTR